MNRVFAGEIPIAYIDEGAGPPVVLTHCSSSSHRMWRRLISELKPNHRVIAPDLIGYGASGVWPAQRPFDLSADAQVLIELVRLADEPVHFVGHSYGGASTLEAVRLMGIDRVRAMTLIEPVYFPLLARAGRMAEWQTMMHVIEGVRRGIAAGNRNRAARAYMGFWMGRLKWQMSPRKAKDNVLSTIEKVEREFQAASDITNVRLEDFKALDVPTLLVYGEETRQPAKALIEVLDELLPQSAVTAVPGAGHMAPVTHRDEVNAIIRAHVAENAATPSMAVENAELDSAVA